MFNFSCFTKPCQYISCKNPTILGCIAGSALMRKAASLAFLNKKRSTVTGDIIDCLGKRYYFLLSNFI